MQSLDEELYEVSGQIDELRRRHDVGLRVEVEDVLALAGRIGPIATAAIGEANDKCANLHDVADQLSWLKSDNAVLEREVARLEKQLAAKETA